MKYSVLAAAIAATMLLTGCDEEPSSEEQQAYIDAEATKQVRAKLSEEEAELKAALAQMQAVDPSIQDIYYSVDKSGERVLHVVHKDSETANVVPGTSSVAPATASASGSVSDTIWPLAGGMAVGAMAMAMVNSGGVNRYAQSHPPVATRQYPEEERRKERNVATSGYVGNMMGGARSSVTRNPNFKTSMRSSVISSRSPGVFSSSGSARSGGYSSGS